MQIVRRDPAIGYLDSMMWVPKTRVNIDGVKNTLTFILQNQEGEFVLELFYESDHHLIVPRAFWEPAAVGGRYIDCRPTGFARTGVMSRIKLDHLPNKKTKKLEPTGKDIQRRALDALLASRGGTLQLACGKGKTVVALELAARMQVPTIICVDNTHLMKQWQEAIEQFLVVPGGVGLIQSEKFDWKRGVVMATYQTLANRAHQMPEEVRRWFGLIVWDEGHHVNAPTFSRSAPLFYGYRLALTATPKRSDGLHVVCRFHVGDIIFKDVIQDLPPKIEFHDTKFTLDFSDEDVVRAVHDVNQELHLSKIATYFGSWSPRLKYVLSTVRKYYDEGRKVLLLSNSVDEVLNLMVLWTKGTKARLYSEIPIPDPADVGFTVDPVPLAPTEVKRIDQALIHIEENLRTNKGLSKNKRIQFKQLADAHRVKLEQNACYQAIARIVRKRQREFIKQLVSENSTAGVFTQAVRPDERMKMLRERRVIFAIRKYGREGLDDDKLDTIVVSEPISEPGAIQQIMGRPRGKKNALLVFLEDDIPPLKNQCRTIRKHLTQWPVDEGGPFNYEMVGFPNRRTPWTRTNQKAKRTFGS